MKNTSPIEVMRAQNNGSNTARQMYPATCSQCSKACEVPFAPSPSKPTYCKECFEKRKLAAKGQVAVRQPMNAPQDNGNGPDVKQQLSAINSKLDRLIQILGTKEPAPVPAKVEEVVAPVKAVVKKVAAKKKAVSKKK